MKWFIVNLQRAEIFKQFVKFCLVGTFNTVLDFSIYLFLTRGVHLYFLYANLISLLVAMTSSFILNKYWTFKDTNKDLQKQYLKFVLVNVVYFFLYNAVLFSLVHWLKIFDLMAKAVAVVAGLFWNFGANRYWTFKKFDKV
jgi:putative flippase GtrA